MPQEPKKRHSRERQGKRRAAIRLATLRTTICPNCKSVVLPHAICKVCGFYKGIDVLKMTKVAKTDEKPS